MYKPGKPYVAAIKEGESVFICQCGHTKTPPYCDGSHNQHPGSTPLIHTAASDESVYICGCGKTGNKPWCDGSHRS